MTHQGFCPVHGPYDGKTCPYPPPHTKDNQWRPSAPAPLSDDDLPTDLGAGYGSAASPAPLQGEIELNEAPMDVTKSRHKILDYDEEEETQLGRSADEDMTELAVASRTTLCMLWVKEGPRRGRFYPVRHGTVIGRREGDIILDDSKVSGSHAKFTMEGEQFFLWDFGSSNGTFVNGRKIRKATPLEENDIIQIGQTDFVVKLLESKPKRKTTSSTKKRSPKLSKKV